MMTVTQPCIAGDIELVQDSLGGDRHAFGEIVRRYQALICALAYSACGDVQASEDLAQTTFITAWRHLPYLEQPGKLKSWLCGIARNVCADFLRTRRRAAAENGQAGGIDDLPSPSLSPGERAVSEEERVILWRSVGALPPSLRDPIVLFYRNGQSVRAVAESLDLSEDAVRQRLTRGRAMLRDSLAGFVETALESTGPTPRFTAAVVAALAMSAVSTNAALAGTAAKTAKVAGAGGIPGTLALFASPALLGVLTGWRMKRDAAASAQGRRAVQAFWRASLIALFACIALPLAVTFPLLAVFPDLRQPILAVMTGWMGLGYIILLAALIAWLLRRRQKPEAVAAESPRSIRYPLGALVLALLVLAVLFLWIDRARPQRISSQEAQTVIAQDASADFWITEPDSGGQLLVIMRPESGHALVTSLDPTLSQLLREKQASIPVLVRGRDYEVLGWPGRLLPLLCVFLAAASIVLIVHRRRAGTLASTG